ncbi:hypothetical protein J2W96_007859, partial [Variovorax guangxiensis]|nr:hypothetical protein [Variovorax guangxiensis]
MSLILQRSGTSQTCCWTNVEIPYGEHVKKLNVAAAIKKYWAQVVIACRVTPHWSGGAKALSLSVNYVDIGRHLAEGDDGGGEMVERDEAAL